MRKLRVGLATMTMLMAAFSRARVSGEAGADQQGSTQENFRVKVTKLIHEEDIIVTQVEIEASRAPTWRSSPTSPTVGVSGLPRPEPTQRKPVAPDPVDDLRGSRGVGSRFHERPQVHDEDHGGSGTATMTNTGPMPRDKRLAETVSVLIEPSEYRYEAATRLVRFQDVTYSLVVRKRK